MGFGVISAHARLVLILICISAPIPIEGGAVRTHFRLADKLLVWFSMFF